MVLQAWWSRIREFLHSAHLDRELAEELQSHLAMAEADKIRRGLSPAEARREARQELGGLTQVREAGYQARGLPWLEAYWLDVKLGLRMLRKSWGLTLIGGLAMTIVIATSLVVFAVVELQFRPTLPLDRGEQVVALQTWDRHSHRRHPTSWRDLELWRAGLRSVQEVGAFQTVDRRLGPESQSGSTAGPRESVEVAEMSAAGFRVARVAPLMGRTLLEADEQPDAPAVVVLGQELWRARFAADPGIVGQRLRLGDVVHTVVGVMPEGFTFPVNHQLWIPLHGAASEATAALGDGGGDGVVFGRLAPHASIDDAQAELATLGLRVIPEGDEELEPRVVPYTFAFTGDTDQGEVRWLIRLVLVLGVLLLVPPCANIAILVYARTVTRQGEFAARYALGASRRRIVAQLFVEMLVLTAAAAGVALVVARLALRWAEATLRQEMPAGPPFWMDFGISIRTVLFAALLAVVAALVAALVPALQATGQQMQTGLRALGSRAGLRLGGTWTALVVAQVALTLATLPAAIEIGWGTIRQGVLGPGFAAESFLTARIALATDEPGFDRLAKELIRSVGSEPAVSGVAVALAVPGDEEWAKIETQPGARPGGDRDSSVGLVRTNRVGPSFFETMQMSLLAGRGFEAGDHGPTSTAVIVNQTLAHELLAGTHALGGHLRYLPSRAEIESGVSANAVPWYEIVGVVEDRPANGTGGTLYHPLGEPLDPPLAMVVSSGPTAGELGRRLRELAAGLDPDLELEAIQTLAEVYRRHQVANNVGAWSLAAVTLSVLLLSAAGLYALLSFTVNQRRREIGIRAALGAPPAKVIVTVFRRAGLQVGAGALLGVLAALLLDHYLPAESVGGWAVPGVIPLALALLLGVAALAAIGPARRALRVAPIDELREG